MHRYLILLFVSLFFSLISCDEKNPSKIPDYSLGYLSVNPPSMVFPNLDGTAGFRITAYADWEVVYKEDWFTVSPVSGSGSSEITVTYTSSPGVAAAGYFEVKAPGHDPDSVRVQLSHNAEPGFRVSPTYLEVSAQSDTKRFSVTASGDWNVSEELDWLTISSNSGNGSGTFTVSILANTRSQQRSGNIAVTALDHFPETITIFVQQERHLPELKVIPEHRDVEYDSEGTGFSVQADGSWHATADIHQRWVNIVHQPPDYFQVLYGINQGPERGVDITLVAEGHNPSQVTVSLTQAGDPGDPPEPPGTLSYTRIFWDQIDLKWTDESENEYGFKVVRRFSQSGWETIADLDPDTEEYSNANLRSRFSYTYHVFAYNDAGDSEPTDDLTVVTHSPVVTGRLNGAPLEGNIEFNGDSDWFSYEVVTQRNYVFRIELIEQGLLDSRISLFGPNNRARFLTSDDNSGGGNASRISHELSAGVYYLRVEPVEVGDTGGYALIARPE